MHKAGKEMRKTLPGVDVVIEILDARIPASSENPLLAQLRGDKPCIKILNKCDLADAAQTRGWQDWLERERSVRSLALSMSQPAGVQRIPDLCRKMARQRADSGKTVTAMVIGIPNVGKSTLINTLSGRTIAKTGNEPAITRGQQRIELAPDLLLLDTPGMLWPNVENRHSGFRLAITGAIKDTALTHDEVAFYAVEYLRRAYPERLKTRYALAQLPDTDDELMELIGQRRGCLRRGGSVDLDKVAKILLNDIRSGQLGGLTWETPSMIATEMALVAEERRKKQAKREARKRRKAK